MMTDDPPNGALNLLWGDTHSHCGISYGYGSLPNALRNARGHLDFCAIIGHATWHDMPERTPGLEFTVDFHRRGFAKLAEHWDAIQDTVESANQPDFVTFHGYEAHSRTFGDYYILSPGADLPLLDAPPPVELIAQLAPRPVIAVPHHIAYVKGFRGIDWGAFSSRISPVVEVYSKHGCSMSDRAPYPFLHGMGPRDSRNTVRAGMRLGHRFGFVASTDHHAGYPGSYGDGRLAVYAAGKTRQAIWEAIVQRRTYAVTGDKISARLRVNGAEMGAEVAGSGARAVELDVVACAALDKIVVYKNLAPWRVIRGETLKGSGRQGTYKVRIEMGWGEAADGFAWSGSVAIADGELLAVEPCWRGRNFLGPVQGLDEAPEMNAINNRITGQTSSAVAWECLSFKNYSTLHPQTAAVILELRGDPATVLAIEIHGRRMHVSIGDLLAGSQAMHIAGYKSEAILVQRAVAQHEYRLQRQWLDRQCDTACDVYDAEIRQINGQCAWLSPIFVLS